MCVSRWTNSYTVACLHRERQVGAGRGSISCDTIWNHVWTEHFTSKCLSSGLIGDLHCVVGDGKVIPCERCLPLYLNSGLVDHWEHGTGWQGITCITEAESTIICSLQCIFYLPVIKIVAGGDSTSWSLPCASQMSTVLFASGETITVASDVPLPPAYCGWLISMPMSLNLALLLEP